MSDRRSPEARFVKEIDRLETFLQSREYLGDYPGLPVQSFLLEVIETLETPVIQTVRDAVMPNSPDT
jgi:5'-deoxynucleotidase YfbR-like HD superfamily hydrolase